MLWGYPRLYRQFAEDVLPAMRAVDELQQSLDLPCPQSEGFGLPTVATLSPTFLWSEDVGGLAEHVDVCTPSASVLASDSNGGRVMAVIASLDGKMNNVYQSPASINSTAEPISAVGGQDINKVPSPPIITNEEQTSDEDNGKSWGIQGPKAEEVGGVSQVRTPIIESTPILPKTETEGSSADRLAEPDSSVCLL